MWAVFIGYTVSASMTAPIIGLYAYRLGATPGQVGAYYATIAITTFVSRLPLASLSKSRPSLNLTRLGLILNLTSLFVLILSPSLSVIYLGCSLRGLGFGSFHPSALSEAVRIAGSSADREKRLGLIMTAPPIGMSIGPLLSSLILAGYPVGTRFIDQYTAVFVVAAVISGAAAAIPGGAAVGDVEDSGGPSSWRQLFSRELALLLSSRFILSYVIGTISSFLPILVVQRGIVPEHEIPILFSVSSVFNILGRPLSAKIGGAYKSLLASSLLIASTAPLLYIKSQWSLYSAMPLYGIAVGLFIPSSLIALQSLVPPSHLTIGIAVLTLGLDLGSSMGSLASGLLLSLAELDIIIPATSAVAGLASAILVWALRLSAGEESGSSEGLAKPNKSIAKNTEGGG